MYELSILHMSKVMTKLKLLKDDCHRHKIQSYLYLSNMYSKPGHTYYEFQSTIIQVPEEYVCMYGHFREWIQKKKILKNASQIHFLQK